MIEQGPMHALESDIVRFWKLAKVESVKSKSRLIWLWLSRLNLDGVTGVFFEKSFPLIGLQSGFGDAQGASSESQAQIPVVSRQNKNIICKRDLQHVFRC